MDIDTIVARLIFSYGIVFLNFAFVILFIKNFRFIHAAGTALLMFVGIMCVAGGIYLDQFPLRSILTDLAVYLPMLLLVPVGCVFVLECFGARKTGRNLIIMVSSLSVLVGLYGIVAILNRAESARVYTPVYASLSLMLVSVIIFEGRELHPLSRLSGGIKFFFILVCIDAILTFLMALGQLLYSDLLLYSMWTLFISNVFFIVVIAFRSPETYRLIEEQAQKLRYQKTRLCASEADSCLNVLDTHMEQKKPYLDPDLSLESLAEQISMNTHELSELLNLHKNMRFHAYINSHRIQYACQALLQNDDRNILQIALDSGFNNKSSFNAVFRDLTNMTPSEYRKKHSK